MGCGVTDPMICIRCAPGSHPKNPYSYPTRLYRDGWETFLPCIEDWYEAGLRRVMFHLPFGKTSVMDFFTMPTVRLRSGWFTMLDMMPQGMEVVAYLGAYSNQLAVDVTAALVGNVLRYFDGCNIAIDSSNTLHDNTPELDTVNWLDKMLGHEGRRLYREPMGLRGGNDYQHHTVTRERFTHRYGPDELLNLCSTRHLFGYDTIVWGFDRRHNETADPVALCEKWSKVPGVTPCSDYWLSALRGADRKDTVKRMLEACCG